MLERNVTISIETPLPLIQASPSDVSTVFRNPIVNGIAHNEALEKHIAIGFQKDGKVNGMPIADAFHVRDNEIGIEPDFHDEVFRMFKRLNQPEAYGEGAGAGLAFVKTIIEGAGGHISVVSGVGKGSTFYFSFVNAAEAPDTESGTGQQVFGYA
ncbi:MAG: ATP-binding protein [Roseobacter sp.]